MTSEVEIKNHSGKKYIRRISPPPGCEPGETDVYAVLEAFDVRCPAIQHALKKLLCAGIRGKNSKISDLREAVDAISRAVQMEEARESIKAADDATAAAPEAHPARGQA